MGGLPLGLLWSTDERVVNSPPLSLTTAALAFPALPGAAASISTSTLVT
jgi:hypothetical protein